MNCSFCLNDCNDDYGDDDKNNNNSTSSSNNNLSRLRLLKVQGQSVYLAFDAVIHSPMNGIYIIITWTIWTLVKDIVVKVCLVTKQLYL